MIGDLLQLFFPKICITCEKELLKNENICCSFCRHDLPLTHITNFKENRITEKLQQHGEVFAACALFTFDKKGKAQRLIHALKYKGRQEVGTWIGTWMGSQLQKEEAWASTQCIIPVPLHPQKKRQRGYNQLTTFGRALAKQLQINYLPNVLLKRKATQSQTLKKQKERQRANKDAFGLKGEKSIQNIHILLIDDVITTGATLQACVKELRKAKPRSISIVCMAVNE